jgi:urease accessory protein
MAKVVNAGRRGGEVRRPVVAGVAYAGSGVPVGQAVAGELFAFAVGITGAALRMRLTDHRRAQVTLRALAPVIAEVTADALTRGARRPRRLRPDGRCDVGPS